MASRLTISATACASARSLLRNFSRAGVATKRSVTSIRVPTGAEAGRTGCFTPASTTMDEAVSAPATRVVMERRATAPMDGRASPRKAERLDRKQIAVGHLGGGVALDRQRKILRRHAVPVVDDADELAAAGLDGDLDGAGARIDRVLDQFLHGRGRTLDHLAGGDAIDQDGIEAADVHRRSELTRIGTRG